jgi:anthranilate synthase component 1
MPLPELINYPHIQPSPSIEQVKTLISENNANCIPICSSLPADLLTPVSAYLKIAAKSKYSFLLESITDGEHIARYSFIGAGKHSELYADVYTR